MAWTVRLRTGNHEWHGPFPVPADLEGESTLETAAQFLTALSEGRDLGLEYPHAYGAPLAITVEEA